VDNSRTLRKACSRDLTAAPRVDYSLARKATLRAFAAGRLSRFEICDAHPELLRAARFCGERTEEACPVCEQDCLVLVSYVFSDEFPKRDNGRVWPRNDLAPLFRLSESRLYTVEVCVRCAWNHVRSQLMLSGDRSLGVTPRDPADGRSSVRRRGGRA
jgi:hypothetical protein